MLPADGSASWLSYFHDQIDDKEEVFRLYVKLPLGELS